LKARPQYLGLAIQKQLLWLLGLPILFFTACHPQPTQPMTVMSESNLFIVSAEVAGLRQQDLSKVRGKVNMYTYLDLKILESHGKADANLHLPVTTCKITRRAQADDAQLKVGDPLKLELGVDNAASPQTFTWIKRLD
jgi:hypothetical protein